MSLDSPSKDDEEVQSQDAASADVTTDDKADPSPAENSAPESSLAALETVLQESKGGEKSPDSEDGQDDQADKKADADKAEDDLPDEVTEDELKRYKPKTQKRMRQLLAQRDAYSQFGSPDDIKQFRDSHERFTQMVNFVNDAGLDSNEVNAGFEIMKLMKADPFKALEALRPYVQQLEELTGAVLPADLKQQVEQGYTTEENAKKLVASQTREQLASAAAQRAAEQAEALRTRQTTETNQVAVSNAVTNWERQWQSTDPDFQAKRSRVSEKVQLAVLTRKNAGQAISPTDAVQIANEALGAVNAEMRSLLPRKEAIAPPVTSGGAAKGARPVPKSSLDVLNNVLSAA